MIHNATHIRKKRYGLIVGGHQASCASMTAIMAALYFHALRPQDKVAVKPHAGPVLHALHYLLINQPLADRKRVVKVKSVQVRGDLGGSSNLKTQKNKTIYT